MGVLMEIGDALQFSRITRNLEGIKCKLFGSVRCREKRIKVQLVIVSGGKQLDL